MHLFPCFLMFLYLLKCMSVYSLLFFVPFNTSRRYCLDPVLLSFVSTLLFIPTIYPSNQSENLPRLPVLPQPSPSLVLSNIQAYLSLLCAPLAPLISPCLRGPLFISLPNTMSVYLFLSALLDLLLHQAALFLPLSYLPRTHFPHILVSVWSQWPFSGSVLHICPSISSP